MLQFYRLQFVFSLLLCAFCFTLSSSETEAQDEIVRVWTSGKATKELAPELKSRRCTCFRSSGMCRCQGEVCLIWLL